MVLESGGDGSLSELDLSRLTHLAKTLEHYPEVRYMSYEAVEAAAETLAARFLELVSPAEMKERAFIPIPRGGLIVLGMLSYLLDLDRDQLSMGTDDSRPVVLVDDVASSGARLRGTLDKIGGSDVIVVHLASHPELRDAVESDPRVNACVAAIDLRSSTDDMSHDEAERFAAFWSDRLDDDRYWYGDPELVAFPWSEPGQLIWEPVDDQVEPGWRITSPERSLETRAKLGPPSLDRANRDFGFPDNIALGRFDDGYLLCTLANEEVFRLDGTAGVIWGALGTLGHLSLVTEHLAPRFDKPPSNLRPDVERLSERLVAAGLLTRRS